MQCIETPNTIKLAAVSKRAPHRRRGWLQRPAMRNARPLGGLLTEIPIWTNFLEGATLNTFCKGCSGPLEYKGRGRRPIWCNECNPYSGMVKRNLPDQTCPQCRELIPRQSGQGRPRKYCSVSCHDSAKRPREKLPDLRSCNRCAAMFSRSDRGQNAKFCSTECKNAMRRKGRPVSNCEMCGVEVISRSRPARWCGDCRVNYSDWQRGRRSGGSRRRVRRFGVDREPINNMMVFERDGWICGICALPVDQTLKWPDPMSATLDHKIPLSKGGSHTYRNVQCSHARCNIVKSDHLEGAA